MPSNLRKLPARATCMLPFPGWDQTNPPETEDSDAESSIDGYLEELDAELTPDRR